MEHRQRVQHEVRRVKAENSGTTGKGWLFTSNSGFTGQVILNGCTSQLNGADGFYFTGTGSGEYVLNGCRSYEDGQNTTAAGITCSSFSGAVIVNGAAVYGGATTAYGVSLTSTAVFQMDNSIISGNTAAVNNGGSNTTVIFGPSVTYGTPAGGVTSTPGYTAWAATDLGYVGYAFDPAFQSNAGTTRLITSNVLNLIGVQVRTPAAVAHVECYVIAAGSGLTTGQNLIGLYDSGGNLRGYTADQTSAWTAAGYKQAIALTAQTAGSLNLTPGLYWVALLGNGSTMPSFSALNASQNVAIPVMNGHAAATAARYATNNGGGSGYTALTTLFTPSSNSLAQIGGWWAAIY